jgi:RNA polymerase sigma-70 factor (ECF subfamily)
MTTAPNPYAVDWLPMFRHPEYGMLTVGWAAATVTPTDATGKVTSRSSADDSELRELMRAYQAGAIEAFDALHARLARSLYQYLAALTRDRLHAQDLLQETLLQIHRSRHAYRPDLPVRPWVFAIARHVSLMDRRTRSRRPATGAELPEIPVPPEVASLASRQSLRRALDRVLPDRREALLLHHVWGLTFAEIGQLLGIRADAAKLRSSRGMADLRQILSKTDG